VATRDRLLAAVVADGDRAAVGGELDRVADEVHEDIGQLAGVGLDGAEGRVEPEVDGLAPGGEERREVGQDPADQLLIAPAYAIPIALARALGS